ncbi:MAG: tetratricopeptide repeat protein [Deltaproteobacteria bacterium]|nr:tetratricopeptide repeat protein [Deltaproteobacteria bacterium]
MTKPSAMGLWALWALFLSSPGAFGQAQDALARAHFSAGSSYYEQGRYEEALHEFEEASRLASERTRPLMIFNLGQAQERLGRLTEAIASFRAYLDAQTNAADRALIEERIRNIQARLDATAISLTVSEPGARVIVDDAERGITPLAEALRVSPGAHEIRVEREGFQPLSIRVSVEPGQRLETEARLVALPVPPAPAPDPVAATPAPAPRPRPRSAPPAERGGRLYTWIAAGVAGAAAVGGGVLGVLALSERDAADDAARERERDAYDESKSSAEDLSLFADVAFGVAVLGAAAAVTLFFVESGAPRAGETAAAPLVLPGGGGAVVSGWF